MKKITMITTILGVLLTNSLMANEEGGMKNQNFSGEQKMQEGNHFQKKDINEVKQRILAKINERINKMNENKNCVNSATTFDALKMCKPKRHEGEERMERMEDKK